MDLLHPFVWIPPSARLPVFVVLTLLTLAVMAGLMALNRRLKRRKAAKKGIVEFELAGELDRARSILRVWGSAGKVVAGLSLGLDYLYLVLYANAIGLGCVLVGAGLGPRAGFLSAAGSVLAWAQYGAALLDAVENWALIRLLLGKERALWPAVAFWCALPKFAAVIAGLAYVLIGGLVLVLLLLLGR
jgi:hypothetical protein